jgi:IS30 family transposase
MSAEGASMRLPQFMNAEHRNRFGHWGGDTVRGKVGRSALVTLVDWKSRFLCCQRVAKANADSVKDVMIDCLSELPSNRVRTITPDRGSEFAKYDEVGKFLMPRCFFQMHTPHSNEAQMKTPTA